MTKRELKIMIMEEVLRVIEEQENASGSNAQLEQKAIEAFAKKVMEENKRFLKESVGDPDLLMEVAFKDVNTSVIQPATAFIQKNLNGLKGMGDDKAVENYFLKMNPVNPAENGYADNLAGQIMSQVTAQMDPKDFQTQVSQSHDPIEAATFKKTISPAIKQQWMGGGSQMGVAQYVGNYAVAMTKGDQALIQKSLSEMTKALQVKAPLFGKIGAAVKKALGGGAQNPATQQAQQ